MAVGASRRKSKGKVARLMQYGVQLADALKAAKNRYVANAQAAAPYYAQGLGEYLNFYLPQIEPVAKGLMQQPGYFENTEAAQNIRIENAVRVAQATSKIASEWRRKKRVGGSAATWFSGGYYGPSPYSSEEKVIKL